MLKDTMVVCDLDGTLLTDKKTISTQTQQYLKRLQEKGVKVVLASGRPYRAIKPYYDQIGLNSLVICYNGGMIINPKNNDEIIFKKDFPKDLVLDIIDKVGPSNFENIMVEDMDTIYLEKENNSMDDCLYQKGMKKKFGHIKSKLKTNPLGVIFYLKNPNFYNKILELGSTSKYKDINIRFWTGTMFAELFFNDINKYTALQIVAKQYHLNNSDIICIGDADNDIEMIYRCGIGVGMKNTDSKFVKQTANLISLDDNNNDGVMKTLKLLIHDDID